MELDKSLSFPQRDSHSSYSWSVDSSTSECDGHLTDSTAVATPTSRDSLSPRRPPSICDERRNDIDDVEEKGNLTNLEPLSANQTSHSKMLTRPVKGEDEEKPLEKCLVSKRKRKKISSEEQLNAIDVHHQEGVDGKVDREKSK